MLRLFFWGTRFSSSVLISLRSLIFTSSPLLPFSLFCVVVVLLCFVLLLVLLLAAAVAVAARGSCAVVVRFLANVCYFCWFSPSLRPLLGCQGRSARRVACTWAGHHDDGCWWLLKQSSICVFDPFRAPWVVALTGQCRTLLSCASGSMRAENHARCVWCGQTGQASASRCARPVPYAGTAANEWGFGRDRNGRGPRRHARHRAWSAGTARWTCRALRCGGRCMTISKRGASSPSVRHDWQPQRDWHDWTSAVTCCSAWACSRFCGKRQVTPLDLTRVVFSDEKFFRWHYTGPAQNSPIWVVGAHGKPARKAGSRSRCVHQRAQLAQPQVPRRAPPWWTASFSRRASSKRGVRINAESCIRMLDDVYLPQCMARLGTDTSSWWWQEDNAPSHTSRRTKAFLKERKIQLRTWPPCSSDLSNSIFETALGERQFTSQLELRAMIVRSWPRSRWKGVHHWVQPQMLGVRGRQRRPISSTACDDQPTCTRFFFRSRSTRLETPTKGLTVWQVFFCGC